MATAVRILNETEVREWMVYEATNRDLETGIVCLRALKETAEHEASRYRKSHLRNIATALTVAEWVVNDLGMSGWCLRGTLDQMVEAADRVSPADERYKNWRHRPHLGLVIRQVRVWSMFGPDWDMLRRFAVCQPADFYIDDRCDKRALAFPSTMIYRAVEGLANWAGSVGLDPRNLHSVPPFYHCGL